MIKNTLLYLEKDRLAHIDMIEPLKRGTADIILSTEEGVLLFERSAQLYLLTVKAPSSLLPFMAKMHRPKLLCLHQDFAVDPILSLFNMQLIMHCRQALWPHPAPPANVESPVLIKPLTSEYIQEVVSLYSYDIGRDYIQNRILAGEMFGAFYGDTLAGFIGLHEEGSMGMLEIRSEFRHQQIASHLLIRLCSHVLSKGQTPFSQFKTNNIPSQKLHEKMGFTISEPFVYWLEGK